MSLVGKKGAGKDASGRMKQTVPIREELRRQTCPPRSLSARPFMAETEPAGGVDNSRIMKKLSKMGSATDLPAHRGDLISHLRLPLCRHGDALFVDPSSSSAFVGPLLIGNPDRSLYRGTRFTFRLCRSAPSTINHQPSTINLCPAFPAGHSAFVILHSAFLWGSPVFVQPPHVKLNPKTMRTMQTTDNEQLTHLTL